MDTRGPARSSTTSQPVNTLMWTWGGGWWVGADRRTADAPRVRTVDAMRHLCVLGVLGMLGMGVRHS